MERTQVRRIRLMVAALAGLVALPIVGVAGAAPRKRLGPPSSGASASTGKAKAPEGKVVPASALDHDWWYYSRVGAKGQMPEMKAAPPRPFDGPPPTVTIEKPTAGAHYKTHDTEVAGMCGPSAECLLDPRDREIVVRVKDWPMTPTGKGVAIVVDNRYGTVVHDLSKPIRMDSFVPFPDLAKISMNHIEMPVSKCGWHVIAAFAVDEEGYGIKTPSALAVTQFFNSYERPNDHRNDSNFGQELAGMVVLNVPLLGRLFEYPGRVPPFAFRAPDPLVLDYYVYQPPAESNCRLYTGVSHINSTEADLWTDLAQSTGLVTLKNLGDDDDYVNVRLQCERGRTGYWSEVAQTLVAHLKYDCVDAACSGYRQEAEPRRVPALAWPVYSPKMSTIAHDRACTNAWLGSSTVRRQVHKSWCEDHRDSPKCADVR